MSNHIDQLKKQAFLDAGIADKNIASMENAWLVSLLGVSPSHTRSTDSLWRDYLVAQGIALGNVQSMQDKWLTGLGYTGSLPNKFAGLWIDGGPATFDGIVRADYETSYDFTVGGGVLTGSPVGGTSVHDGLLDLSQANSGYVTYDPIDNFQPTTIVTINLLYTPAYTTTPPTIQIPFMWGREADTRNAVWLQHIVNGNLELWIRQANGTYVNSVSSGVWNPTSGQEYEIEVNMDIATGATRIFIDGTQFGATIAGVGALTVPDTGFTPLFRVGSHQNPGSVSSRFSLADLKIYETIQHTSNY